MSNTSTERTHTPSQIYLSTRRSDYGLSFEAAVRKGLAADGGLFLPKEVPVVIDYIFSLYISTDEIATADLKAKIDRSYSTFRAKDITALVHLTDNLYLLELFHGPSYSFRDCKTSYFIMGNYGCFMTLVTIGCPAIPRNKEDISVSILHLKVRISPRLESQMTTVLDGNSHNLAVKGTFDDCQDIVKTLFGDHDTNHSLKHGSINSSNFARILAQIVYYFNSYSTAIRSSLFNIGDKDRFITPYGNFGNILAGYFVMKMGLPVDRLVDIDDKYSKKQAGQEVSAWSRLLKATDGFGPFRKEIMEKGCHTFESERVSDLQTSETIKSYYEQAGYIPNNRSAVGVAAAERSIPQNGLDMPHISLSTTHPAKFAGAIELALKHKTRFNFEEVLPPEFRDLAQKEKRVVTVDNSWEKVREIVKKQVAED